MTWCVLFTKCFLCFDLKIQNEIRNSFEVMLGGGQTHGRRVPGSFIYRQAGTSHCHRTLQRLQPRCHSTGQDAKYASTCGRMSSKDAKICKDIKTLPKYAKIQYDKALARYARYCHQLMQRYAQNRQGMPRYAKYAQKIAETFCHRKCQTNARICQDIAEMLRRYANVCKDMRRYPEDIAKA